MKPSGRAPNTRPIRRLSVYILAGIPLVPIAAVIGFVATCIPFPFVIPGMFYPLPWKIALGMAAAGTIFILPLASTLCDYGFLKADLFYKFCGSAGSIICMCCLAIWVLLADLSGPISIAAVLLSLYIFASMSFGAYAAGYYSAAIHRRIILATWDRFYQT